MVVIPTMIYYILYKLRTTYSRAQTRKVADFLLIAVKELLEARPDLRVVRIYYRVIANNCVI